MAIVAGLMVPNSFGSSVDLLVAFEQRSSVAWDLVFAMFAEIVYYQ